jgi:hypothetical protein
MNLTIALKHNFTLVHRRSIPGLGIEYKSTSAIANKDASIEGTRLRVEATIHIGSNAEKFCGGFKLKQV